jgi:hypothetical protein
MKSQICRKIWLENGTTTTQQEFAEQKAEEFCERFKKIPVFFSPKCIHDMIVLCDDPEAEWPEDQEEWCQAAQDVCRALETSRRMEAEQAGIAPESPASVSLEVIQPEHPPESLNTDELILRGATETRLDNGGYNRISEVFEFNSDWTDVKVKSGAIATAEHDGMLLGLGFDLGKRGVWLCIQGAQRLIAGNHDQAFEQACASLKISPSTLYNYLRCLPYADAAIRTALPITVIAEICTAKYSDDKAENDKVKKELLSEAVKEDWDSATARSHSKMRRGHDEEINDGTKQSPKARIMELEQALVFCAGSLREILEGKEPEKESRERAFQRLKQSETLLGYRSAEKE